MKELLKSYFNFCLVLFVPYYYGLTCERIHPVNERGRSSMDVYIIINFMSVRFLPASVIYILRGKQQIPYFHEEWGTNANKEEKRDTNPPKPPTKPKINYIFKN